MTSKDVDSPCVRNCCLDQQDMCVGCFRMLDEIVGWGTASSVRKKKFSLLVHAVKVALMSMVIMSEIHAYSGLINHDKLVLNNNVHL
ncbi:DUF1289 domain-containing protein [Paraglaciecola sp. Hal342]